MHRRSVLLGPFTALATARATPLFADTSCGPIGCRAQVSFQQFAATYDLQHQSEWCWAASLSMLFGYYGHRLSQQAIVGQTYGALANLPAMSGAVIAQALNRQWIDDRGQSFLCSLNGVFDAAAGVSAIDASAVIQSLANNQPLIVGALGHVMVLTLCSYQQTPFGPRIVEMGVFDPWPGRGARDLSPIEITPAPMGGLQFLASITVS